MCSIFTVFPRKMHRQNRQNACNMDYETWKIHTTCVKRFLKVCLYFVKFYKKRYIEKFELSFNSEKMIFG